MTGAVIGGISGGLVAVAVLLFVVIIGCCWYHRRERIRSQSMHDNTNTLCLESRQQDQSVQATSPGTQCRDYRPAKLAYMYIIKAPARERVQRALGVWDVLFTHCCDSKARQHSPSLQCRPKGLPKATKEFEVRSINIAFKQYFVALPL